MRQHCANAGKVVEVRIAVWKTQSKDNSKFWTSAKQLSLTFFIYFMSLYPIAQERQPDFKIYMFDNLPFVKLISEQQFIGPSSSNGLKASEGLGSKDASWTCDKVVECM